MTGVNAKPEHGLQFGAGGGSGIESARGARWDSNDTWGRMLGYRNSSPYGRT